MKENRIALITGVSRLKGIGFAICKELAKQNIDVFFTYWKKYDQQMPWGVDDNEPELIKNEIRKLGVKCENCELDLSINNAEKLLLDEVESKLGTPSILINNATYSSQTNLDTLSVSELDKHYQVNLKATTMLSLDFIRRYQNKNGGRIVNLISGQSLGEMDSEIAYAITKGAIETLTKTISKKIAEMGITINAVNPGPTDTGWMDEKTKKTILLNSPTGRLGLPEDAAKLVSFLVSKDAEWITGQIIHSEGGFKR